MTYNTIADMAEDQDLKRRVTACAAEQGVDNPMWWADQNLWNVVASPGWASAWEYAIALNMENPGADESVITDATILATVQPLLAAN